MFARLRPSRPEDPQHSQVAVRALINAGYAPHEAGRAFVQYRARVRAAIAAWPAIAFAGLLTALIPALVLAVLGAAPTALLLCVLGVGLGFIERLRWRREYVLGEFKVESTDQQYLLYQGGLWSLLLVLLTLLQWTQAGSAIGLVLYMGLPLTLVYRYFFYRTYPTALAIVSNAPAGAKARSIIELETNLPEASSGYDPDSTRPALPMARQRASFGLEGRVKKRFALFLGGLVAWWFLARWWVWQGSEVGTASLVPFSGDVVVDVVGIALGTTGGAGLVWFYENFIES